MWCLISNSGEVSVDVFSHTHTWKSSAQKVLATLGLLSPSNFAWFKPQFVLQHHACVCVC